MKKSISILLAVLMLLGCVAVASVSAASDCATVTFNGTTYNYALDSEVVYTCNLKCDTIIENGQYKIVYPQNILKIESYEYPVVEAIGGGMINYEENLANECRFNFSDIARGYDFKENPVLIKITFKAIAAGEGTVALEKEVTSDTNDNDVLSACTFTETISDSTYNPADNVCTHKNTTVKGKKAATYFAKGYSGDKVCKDCGKVIKKGSATAMLKLKTPKMTVTAAKKAIKVKYTKVTGATGFQVSYKLSGKKAVVKTFKTAKTATKTIKGLKSGKKYTVKIRAYVQKGSSKKYSSYAKAKTVKVK